MLARSLFLLACAVAASSAAEKPNFILIFADDQGWQDLGIQGHPDIRTPNIDRMAREGMRFTSFYAAPFCGPSRAAMMTGCYPPRVSLAFNHGPNSTTGIHPDDVTVAEMLQQSGYATAFVGKWHMGAHGDDPRPGFDHWVSFRGQGNYLSPGPRYTLNVNGQRVPQKGYITDELTDYAVDWLEEQTSEKPFFLYLSHNRPRHGK